MVEATALAGMVSQLPEILFFVDIIFYIFSILFFGSIVTKGFRGYLHPLVHLGLRIGMGFISIIGGISLSWLFPSLSEGFFQFMRASILAGSLVSSIILAIGLYLVTFRMINVKALNKMIENIKKKIASAKKNPNKRGLKDPIKLAGVAIILGFLIYSLITFNGFPSISDDITELTGISLDEIKNLGGQLEDIGGGEGDLPDGCMSMISILTKTGPDLTKLTASNDEGIKKIIEDNSGSTVVDLRIADIEGETYYIAITQESKICSSTNNIFCSCLDISQFS